MFKEIHKHCALKLIHFIHADITSAIKNLCSLKGSVSFRIIMILFKYDYLSMIILIV